MLSLVTYELVTEWAKLLRNIICINKSPSWHRARISQAMTPWPRLINIQNKNQEEDAELDRVDSWNINLNVINAVISMRYLHSPIISLQITQSSDQDHRDNTQTALKKLLIAKSL